MISTRAAVRAQRTLRFNANTNAFKRQVRFASEGAPKPATAAGGGGVAGGLIGASGALGVAYLYYHFSGAKSAVQTAKVGA